MAGPLRQRARFILGIAVGLLALLLFASSVYTVQPSEEVVVTRLGRYNRTTAPGLHFAMPLGIEQTFVVRTKLVLQEEFGFRTSALRDRGPSSYQEDGGYDKESQMLTGDLNVADVEWILHYQISEPRKYLFNTNDPTRNIRDISEAIMRRVVGDRTVNEVLTTGRVEVARQARLLTQEVLDHYDLGVYIVTVKLQDVNPPRKVKDSFNEVNAAKQEQEQAINNAEEAYNKVIFEAKGQAEETISEADGFASAVVNRARGDADRFVMTLRAYKAAPEITRRRLYLEAMEDIFLRLTKLTIVDDQLKGVLPVFNRELTGSAAAK
jgi:membrane protease subunit HflK